MPILDFPKVQTYSRIFSCISSKQQQFSDLSNNISRSKQQQFLQLFLDFFGSLDQVNNK